jgi:hypothetical protein
LAFPELALGDLYKTVLLCESKLIGSSSSQPLRYNTLKSVHLATQSGKESSDQLEDDFDTNSDTTEFEEIEVIYEAALLGLFDAMRSARCFSDCIEFASWVKDKTYDPAIKEIMREQMELTNAAFAQWSLKGCKMESSQGAMFPKTHGFIFRRKYPWMQDEHSKLVNLCSYVSCLTNEKALRFDS